MIIGRATHAATLLLDGRVLITGGYGGTPIESLDSAELFDPALGGFVPAGTMTSPRQAHAAVPLRDGRVLIAGGYGRQGEGCQASAELYDPATGRFSPTGSMGVGRCYATAVLLADGRVLVVGGGGAPGTAEVYDPATGRFSPAGSLVATRDQFHTATLLADGRVLVAGGTGYDGDPGVGNNALDAAEVFDPRTRTWSRVASMSVPRNQATATSLADGRILVVGGQGIIGCECEGSSSGPPEVYATTESFDPATNTWTTAAGSLAAGRFGHVATPLTDGRVLLTGGELAGWSRTAAAEVYDPAIGAFIPAGSMDHPRFAHAATLLTDGRVLVTGGDVDGPDDLVYDSAELYDPTTGLFARVGG